MAYVFGTTFVCDNMDNAKKVGMKSVFNILPLYNEGQVLERLTTSSPSNVVTCAPRILRRRHHHPSTTGKDGAFIEISSQTPRFAIIHLTLS